MFRFSGHQPNLTLHLMIYIFTNTFNTKSFPGYNERPNKVMTQWIVYELVYWWLGSTPRCFIQKMFSSHKVVGIQNGTWQDKLA